ncbi:MAG: TauD/TfdA family dioxygenase [Rhodospirillaceae bacterium]|jgi:alpha-ketoglutarate-dependent taurine dioxygenase|nr:TauD/TfdA family dioxygenase [Rhodospirillaceae bacterium]MBT4486566.1 TauD/TfdA family dioxygenase [Rhodospirillaceae bacterium]MBT5192590.1 TauD/TfdA family dioxygenase [Rhodospirillaceae bacterium]MBT5896732.1 TauD/TfdA family dioxygenase [Rhodospirillaceae bacterium]MBT6426491.1 TauD/TfdA family dioxygenase [Rhodospirillaceae bacterium]
MQPTITPLDATLGASITDIDLANLNEDTWAIVEDAFHEYAALVFPEQNLTDEAQIAFANRFGDMEILRDDPNAKAVNITNQKPDGSILQPDEHRYQALRGNEGWHTDSSYMPLAAKASILAALTVPSAGGETAVADMRAAYDDLDQDMKDRIEGLSAHHSLYQSQAKIGHIVETGAGYGYHDKGAPLRPLVNIHPVTGRKSLFIGRHAYSIPGMDDGEAQELLDELLDFACQPPRTYFHSWRPGDVFMWDNRCTLHAARPYDYGEARIMRHTRIAGDPVSELVATGRDARAADFVPSSTNR